MTTSPMKIITDDLKGPEIAALLQEHLDDMHRTSPPDSVHALDLKKLRDPAITFWSLWQDDQLAGCGALKRLSKVDGELKSMRTSSLFRGQGVASRILEHVLQQAKQGGLTRLSLETGSMDFFDPARRLYEKYGFETCAPFGDYLLDPNSVFMTRPLVEH